MTERPVPGEHPDDEAVLRHADGAAPRPGEEALFAALDRTRADLAAAPRPAPPEGLAAALQAALAANPGTGGAPTPGSATSGPSPADPGAGRPPATGRVAPARPAGRPGFGPTDRRGPRRPGRARRRLVVGGLTALAALAVLVGIGTVGGGSAGGGGEPAPTAAPGPAPVVVSSAELPRAFRSGLGARDPSLLSDPVTRAGCLVAHGLPAGTVPLGTRAVVVDGRPGTLLVLATGRTAEFRLLVVGPGCSADRPDTVADTTVGG